MKKETKKVIKYLKSENKKSIKKYERQAKNRQAIKEDR
jgi:hypothetical protein